MSQQSVGFGIMCKYTQPNSKQLLHSLFRLFCPAFLELTIAAALFNHSAFLQPVQAKTSSQQQSLLLTQVNDDEFAWEQRSKEYSGKEDCRKISLEYRSYYIKNRTQPINYPYTYWFDLGDKLEKARCYEDAYLSFNRASELNPNDANARLYKGITRYRQERYQEALTSFNEAVELNPKYANAWNWKGNAHYKNGSYEDAVKSFDKAINLQRNEAIYLSNRADALDKLGLYPEAMDSTDKASRLKPQCSFYLYTKAKLHFKLKQYDAAIKIFDSILNKNQADPRDCSIVGRSRIVHFKGSSLLEKGNSLLKLNFTKDALAEYERAIAEYERAIEFNNYAVSNSNLVDLSDDLGIHNSLYGKGRALYRKGGVLEKLELLQEAINSFDRAIAIKPDFQTAKDARAQTIDYMKSLKQNK